MAQTHNLQQIYSRHTARGCRAAICSTKYGRKQVNLSKYAEKLLMVFRWIDAPLGIDSCIAGFLLVSYILPIAIWCSLLDTEILPTNIQTGAVVGSRSKESTIVRELTVYRGFGLETS